MGGARNLHFIVKLQHCKEPNVEGLVVMPQKMPGAVVS